MSVALQELQRRMAAAVMEPLTDDETMREVRLDGTRMESEAADFIKPNATLTSFERLEIYNRQYWFRLYSSFEDDFPGLRVVLGGERFELVMRSYLQACPSRSFTLRDLGSRLPDFLREREDLLEPNAALAQDMVQLEWAHIEAYDAASLPVADTTFFQTVKGETVLALQPFVRLLELSYPVDDLLIAVRKDEESSDTSSNNAQVERKHSSVRRIAELPPARIWLAVHRQEFTVYYKRLTREEHRMLLLLRAGAPLAEVISQAFRDSQLDEATQAALLQEAFRQWAALGWISAP
jgi:hypothetical protein